MVSESGKRPIYIKKTTKSGGRQAKEGDSPVLFSFIKYKE